MRTKIPTRFYFKYWALGTSVIVLFALLMLSSEDYIYVPLINRLGFLIFIAFSASFVAYAYFELTNIRDAASFDYPYYYDYNGIYRAHNLIANWVEIAKVSFRRVTFTETIAADYAHYSRNRLMTREPLNSVMYKVNVREIKVRKRLSVLEIKKTSGNRLKPDIVIDMSPKRFFINRTYRKMKRFSEMGSANVEFNLDIDSKVEDDSTEDPDSSVQPIK